MDKQQIIDSLGIKYEFQERVPMFHVKDKSEVQKIHEALWPIGSYGYWIPPDMMDEIDHPEGRDVESVVMTAPEPEEKPKKKEKKIQEKGIFMYDKKDHTKLIKVFDNMNDVVAYINPEKAASVRSSISGCLTGRASSACGYWWEKKA